jgi:hypothetical protein
MAPSGFLMLPAIGAIIMSLSTIIAAINAKLLKRQFPKESGKAQKQGKQVRIISGKDLEQK